MSDESTIREPKRLLLSAAFHGALIGWLTFGWPVSAVNAGLSTGDSTTLFLLVFSWLLAAISVTRFIREGRRDKWTQIGFAAGVLLTMFGIPREALWL
jgi:hypothetical protein